MRQRSHVLLVAVLVAAAVLTGATPASGTMFTGSGTEADPYVITTVLELQAMQDDLSAHYVLGNDIDASDTVNWNGGSGFDPIGANSEPFLGRFDGRGHSITGLTINRLNENTVGLFAVLSGFDVLVTNVHLVDADVTGDSYVGTLTGGMRQGTVRFSSATGTVTLKSGSGDSKSGGLIGWANSGAQITRSWTDVTVHAASRRQVGGLVGYLRGVEGPIFGTVTDSYSGGTVYGSGAKQGNLVGDADGSLVYRSYSSGAGKALIGYNFRGPVITDSYWDGTVGASSSPYGGSPRTTAQMMQQATFVDWDFGTIWAIDEATSYPYLQPPPEPIVVTTVEELQAMTQDLGAYYVLGNDIDASDTVNWNDGKGFRPVYGSGFRGHFDGRGHTITGLYINRPDGIGVGLFGFAVTGATITNVHLRDVDVTGDRWVGALIGRARGGLVTRALATGIVKLKAGSGDSKSGGLIGFGGGGAGITIVWADVEVHAGARWQVGGLIGYLRGRPGEAPTRTGLSRSYSHGSVIGTGAKVANLVGDADAAIIDRTYSTGPGRALVGFNFMSPIITRSYWDSTRGASSSSFGGQPRTTAEMMQEATFNGWNFDVFWDITEGSSYPYLRDAPPPPPPPLPDPIVITTVEELQAVRDDLDAHYVLGNDIDASDTVNWNDGKGFQPIGDDAGLFTGTFDGRGHTITGLVINRVDENRLGLFGYVTGRDMIITNVHLVDVSVTGDWYVGTLVGGQRGGVVSRSSATGVVHLKPGSKDSKSGGLIGRAGNGALVTEVWADVDVHAGNRVQVGGLVGYLRGVESTSPRAMLTNSYAAGTVFGGGWKQGNLLGDADNGVVDRSYSSGDGKALVGFNFRSPTITRSYWDSTKGAASSSRGGQPRTTAQMKQQATFVGWDFDSIWGIDEENSYPYLLNAQPNLPPPPPPPPTPEFCNGVAVTIAGTAGNDILVGTDGVDVIAGGSGDDVIVGRGGDDMLCGNQGHDRILGGPGDDILLGNTGDDRLHGGPGSDWLRGAAGDDSLFGDGGRDYLYGAAGDDTVWGGNGNDLLIGGNGDDVLNGGKKVDRANGGPGVDSCTAEIAKNC